MPRVAKYDSCIPILSKLNGFFIKVSKQAKAIVVYVSCFLYINVPNIPIIALIPALTTEGLMLVIIINVIITAILIILQFRIPKVFLFNIKLRHKIK